MATYPRLTQAQEKQWDKFIIDTFVKKGVRPDLAKMQLAQCRYETTHYSSRAFNEEKNIGGLKYPGNGVECTKGKKSPEGDYYAKYATVADSAADMANWLLKNNTAFSAVKSIPDFASVLKAKGYFSAPLAKYAADIGSIFKKQLAYIILPSAATQATAAKKNSNPQSLVFS